jgi:hypothetical protein
LSVVQTDVCGRRTEGGQGGAVFILPLLGIIFLPFTTLIYVIVYVPGVGLTGWGFIWVIIALLLDLSHWGASYTTCQWACELPWLEPKV